MPRPCRADAARAHRKDQTGGSTHGAVAIPDMGLTLAEIFYLEELAADCAADGRWKFFLVAPPLPVTRGVGTPINPYAMKRARSSR